MPPLQNMEDPEGNKVKVTNGRVFLYLKDSSRKLHIGDISDEEEELVVRRDREKHLFRANQSYGFNYFIIKNTQRFKSVRLIDQYGEYVLPNEVILEDGKFLHHQKSGMEKQLFVSLEIIENHKTKGVMPIGGQ